MPGTVSPRQNMLGGDVLSHAECLEPVWYPPRLCLRQHSIIPGSMCNALNYPLHAVVLCSLLSLRLVFSCAFAAALRHRSSNKPTRNHRCLALRSFTTALVAALEYTSHTPTVDDENGAGLQRPSPAEQAGLRHSCRGETGMVHTEIVSSAEPPTLVN